mmetsp:Transcript_13085/g.19965  ORF Transcript_13085/g.19965 Transcript_13085/m.19965 type:complete len:212 (+) Transcript_13085:173-808(+)
MISENKEPLKVMFGGLGRTGSHSIAAALNRLGFKACHGSDIVKYLMGSHHNLAKAMIRGNMQEIMDATSALGYNATMEAHSVFWEDVFKNEENYKDTKFIFTKRDFDSWFDSFIAMRHATRVMNRFPLRLIPFFKIQTQWSSALSARQFQLDDSVDPVDFVYYPERDESKLFHKARHSQNQEASLRITEETPDRALLFDVKTDGYGKLCNL